MSYSLGKTVQFYSKFDFLVKLALLIFQTDTCAINK